MSDDMSENGCQYEERVGLTGSDFFCENQRNVDLSESSVEIDHRSQLCCLLCVELSASLFA
jgi:hypothetical protein